MTPDTPREQAQKLIDWRCEQHEGWTMYTVSIFGVELAAGSADLASRKVAELRAAVQRWLEERQ